MKFTHLPRFIYFYFQGLERNFKIIKYGDVPEVYVNPVIQERYSFARSGFLSYLRVLKELARHLLRPAQKFYKVPCSDVIFCGGSANNEREFNFFSALLVHSVPQVKYGRESNLSFVASSEFKKKLSERVISALLLALCCIYIFRIKLNPTSFKYLFFYSKIYLQVFFSFERFGSLPKALVVANDHTDFPVVADMVMKYFHIPVIYVQHAEISEAFPSLNFDISLLRNQRSLEKYQAIGRVKGDIYIIPRTNDVSNASRILGAMVVAPIHVVLYLSSVYDESVVRSCIERLSNNPSVNRVSIKRHPRTPAEELKNVFDIEVLDGVFSEDHVAIVPNSSVVVELLARGIRVFQYFALDNIRPDYYGFVADGITTYITYQDLLVDFWRVEFYSSDWLERFFRYSAIDDDSWSQQVQLLSSKIQHVLR